MISGTGQPSRIMATLLALSLAGAVAAAPSSERWTALRAQSSAQLETALSNAPADAAVRLRLVLADRALNQSIAKVTEHLSVAEGELQPGSESDVLARLIRCQLEHRQGLAAAQASCEVARDSGERPSAPFLEAYWHATRAYLAYREGQHRESRQEAATAAKLAEGLGDADLAAYGHNMLGLYYSTHLRPRMAHTHFEAAWEFAGKMRYSEVRHMVQLNLAGNYNFLGRPGEALELLKEVMDSPITTIYPTRLLITQSMLAMSLSALGRAGEAEAALSAAIEQVENQVLPDALTFGNTSLGMAQLAQGRPQDALESFHKVLESTGRTLDDGLEHPRIQLLVVPYARALWTSGAVDEAIGLLNRVIRTIPVDEPDQLLVDAYSELAAASNAAGDRPGAVQARAQSALLQQQLWDQSFQYRVARLNGNIEARQQAAAAERAQQREQELAQTASRETQLRRQSWLIAALLIALALLLQSRRMQKRLRQTERRANERLEELVQNRTQALEDEMAERLRAEADRRELQSRLAETEKLRVFGQLSAGVAHDFNNLLTVVTLAADQLRSQSEQPAGPLDKDCLDSISEASETGRRITNGLMAYARKQPLKPAVLRLDRHVEGMLPLLKNTLGESYELRAILEPCMVRVDQGQLTTALLNLLLNAREAMPLGGTVQLTLTLQDGEARLAVEDHGHGIPKADLQRAAEPFFTTKTAGAGTGLGLSMVEGFSRQSGGDLKIDSTEGQGTKVTILLPLHLDLVIGEQGEARSTAAVPQNLSILVVEDRSTLRQMLKRTLTQLGHEVRTASDGADALAQIDRDGPPRLLITDVVMPGPLRGPDLADTLRHDHPELAVLLISGYSEDYQGSYRFLRKPFSADELEQAIGGALEGDGDSHEPMLPSYRSSEGAS